MKDPSSVAPFPAPRVALVAALAAGLAAPHLFAQELSLETRAPFLPAENDFLGSILRQIVPVDVDGDGDLDLWESGVVHLNDGRANFTRAQGAAVPALYYATASDVLVDGRLDVLAMTSGGIRIFVNRAGRFVDETSALFPSDQIDRFRTGSIVTLDYDGDGDRDLLMLTRQDDAAYELDLATFTEAPAIPFQRDPVTGVRIEGANSTLALAADFDRDGYDDFVLPSSSGSPWAAIAGGPQGVMRNESANWLQAAMRFSYSDGTVGDFDGDGAPDIALVNRGGGPLLLLRNEIALGNGFVDATTRWWPGIIRCEDFVAFDLDGDGDAELVASNPAGIHLLDLPASGGFVVAQGPLPGTARRTALLAAENGADLDRDGNLDLVIQTRRTAFGQSAQIWLGQGGIEVAPNGTPREIASGIAVHAIAFADLDGDLDLDAVVNDPSQALVQKNDGRGGFTPFGQDAPTDLQRAVVGDVDGDGDLDLVVSFASGRRRLARNDGAGRLQLELAGLTPDGFFATYDLDLVDLNGDGTLDLVCANQGQDQVFLGGGPNGDFVDATARLLPVDEQLTTDITPLDVDGDGDLDLYQSSSYAPAGSRPDRLLINTGGTFRAAPQGTLPNEAASWTAIPEDFDGDGDLDLVTVGTRGVRFLENVSTATSAAFQLATGPGFPDVSNADYLEPGDLDGDGDLDLLIREELGGLDALRRTGAVGYRLETGVVVPGQIGAVTFANFVDLDDDGDADSIALDTLNAPSVGPIRVLLNRSRQLEANFPARLGGSLQIDFAVLDAGVASGGIAWPVFSPGLAAQPMPLQGLGTLRLDPNTLISEAPVFVGTGTATAFLSLPMPTQASLLGVTIHSQALVAPRGNPMRARLSNLVSLEIIR